MWKARPGSTAHLLQLCLGYFVFYVIFGVSVKYFQGSPERGLPGMNGMEFLVYSTLGGTVVALFVCLGLRWYRLESNHPVQWGPVRFPSEWFYIVPSGVLTAIIIPTTTLMYSLPISVMVAMVIMRGAIIVVSRIVDAVQIRQGLLKKRVYREEDWAVVFALLAVATTVVIAPARRGSAGNHFEFLHSTPAMIILGSYVIAYALRIYIMNYYKNTRGKGVRFQSKGFFAVEQMAAFATLVIVTSVLLALPSPTSLPAAASEPRALHASTAATQLVLFQRAFHAPHPEWEWGALAGTAFGIVAFFSVFLFLFQGRTATFAGLVNRLTSLVAGTTATLVFFALHQGPFPAVEDWLSLVFILIAVWFLSIAERKRTAELAL
jgi:hypothetical protein